MDIKISKKVKTLVDVKVEIELSVRHYHWQTMEQYAKCLESAVSDFHDFLKDHRSQDINHMAVERIYEEQCSECGDKYEEEIYEDNSIHCASCGAISFSDKQPVL